MTGKARKDCFDPLLYLDLFYIINVLNAEFDFLGRKNWKHFHLFFARVNSQIDRIISVENHRGLLQAWLSSTGIGTNLESLFTSL